MDYPFSSPGGYEEGLNRQFAGYLFYSLQTDETLLNHIQQDISIELSEGAALVANQDSPLQRNTDEGTNRELDWVVRDDRLLVGYESKYGDTLTRSQLRDELAKLRVNADGREVHLIAITPHTTRPAVLNDFDDEPVSWLSWFTVARRLNDLDEAEIDPEQRPILRMLQDLFEAEDMHPFTGFTHSDKQQYRYFIRDLRQELAETDLENTGKVHTWTTENADPAGYKRIIPRYVDIPFVSTARPDTSRDTKRGSYLAVIVDTETHEVHAGIALNVRENERHAEYVAEHTDDLVDHAEEHGLSFWTSMNSLNQWKSPAPKTDDPAEMRTWLEAGGQNEIEVDGTSFKKAFFVKACSGSDPASLITAAKSVLLDRYEEFLVDDALFPYATLE
ncbi:hypothetical protein [Halorarius litoreus]|uniref:hypothetical protein n=1 Tax=Halorarius litoreus TaxID=2962676 RepID=UPI0020CFC897|nr:hypothetical protein [Halorarius litoreus]